ncbi:MAG: anhydro-N-acetylmuramic acid kinase, partial [Candidatus Eremiobacteraeota bacterium]|nr:anhydro-N-acetylmuramic acid kinase [Candidatus Eremiobacteraeota bacterium]
AIRTHAPTTARVIVSGGGAHNAGMLTLLRRLLPQAAAVDSSAALGVDPDAKEALAFAILGYEALRGRTANLPRVTGARRPVVLGSIVPHDLAQLLNKIEIEIRDA